MSALTGFRVAGSAFDGPLSANSYVSVEDFERYLAEYPADPAITLPSDDTEKTNLLERTLKISAQMLDGIGLADNRWYGSRTDSNQVLAWPRTNVSYDGALLDSRTIPTAICTAQCVMAVYLLQGQLTPDEAVAPNETVKREQVGPIMTEYAIYGRYVYLGREIQKRVEEIIGGLLKPIGQTLADLTRSAGFGGGVFGFEAPSGVVDVNIIGTPDSI